MQAGDLLVGELAGSLDGGETSPVQDLVRIGVTYPGEDARIGEGPLHCAVLPQQRFGKLRQGRLDRFHSPAIMLGEGVFSAHDPQAGALLGGRLAQQHTSMLEIERSQSNLAWDGRPGSNPGKPAGDHQMDNHKQLLAQIPDDSLPDAAQTLDGATFHGRQRRIIRSKQRR